MPGDPAFTHRGVVPPDGLVALVPGVMLPVPDVPVPGVVRPVPGVVPVPGESEPSWRSIVPGCVEGEDGV
ncbi:hypothetical protein [Sphingomonas sp. ID0503]|uniref:hypothetical protein n=1 Tax=Sphingomonas sp. ID0503 TaxID=3399691 RepID=UPI003AFB624D